jgi:hypothetical protein
LLGSSEVAELLGLTRQGLHRRRAEDGDFPSPLAELKATPVWSREQPQQYARERAARLEERAGVERLAAEDPGYVTLEQAAATLGVAVWQLEGVIREYPTMPRRFNLRTGKVVGIDRADLGLYARALGVTYVERAVV